LFPELESAAIPLCYPAAQRDCFLKIYILFGVRT